MSAFLPERDIDGGEQLEGGKRPQNDIDLVALDHFLRLVLGAGRISAGVSNDQIDLASRECEVLVLEK